MHNLQLVITSREIALQQVIEYALADYMLKKGDWNTEEESNWWWRFGGILIYILTSQYMNA